MDGKTESPPPRTQHTNSLSNLKDAAHAHHDVHHTNGDSHKVKHSSVSPNNKIKVATIGKSKATKVGADELLNDGTNTNTTKTNKRQSIMIWGLEKLDTVFTEKKKKKGERPHSGSVSGSEKEDYSTTPEKPKELSYLSPVNLSRSSEDLHSSLNSERNRTSTPSLDKKKKKKNKSDSRDRHSKDGKNNKDKDKEKEKEKEKEREKEREREREKEKEKEKEREKEKDKINRDKEKERRRVKKRRSKKHKRTRRRERIYKLRPELFGASDEKLVSKLIPSSFAKTDIVLIKEAWNKIFPWRDMFMEAVFYRAINLSPSFGRAIEIEYEATQDNLLGMFDIAARSLAPHTEVVHRESFRALHPSKDREFNTMEEYADHYAHMAVTPIHWYAIQEAWMFALNTHTPYFEEQERQDATHGQNAILYKFFSTYIMKPAFDAYQKMHTSFKHEPYLTQIPQFWKSKVANTEQMFELGQNFYVTLLTKYPVLLHFFASADMDHLSIHLSKTLDMVFSAIYDFPTFIPVLKQLGNYHKTWMIPSWTYALIGAHILETLDCPPDVEKAVGHFYKILARVQQAPVLAEERMIGEAERWLKDYAAEMNWGQDVFDKRFLEICSQIGSTGTYTHSTEELSHGAKIAWRNSVKCIGRISWNTLLVRDMRHVIDPKKMFDECIEHQRLATAGSSVQSVMTIFTPRLPRQPWGCRIWNPQFMCYAGYQMDDGTILGDPAKVSLTQAIINQMGWKPPNPKTQFDVLPLVIQVPDQDPILFEWPKEYAHQVDIEHPTNAEVGKLGLKWCAVPTISNFNFKLGGISYPACPFNGWFMDMEVARNLYERYNQGPVIAKLFGLDPTSEQNWWRQKVFSEMCQAALYSFQKAKVTMVDAYTCSGQFMTHCKRERESGREVPAQWSWIGGFAGLLCPVWSHEMRDFVLEPQYHYCSDIYTVNNLHDLNHSSSAINHNNNEPAAHHQSSGPENASKEEYVEKEIKLCILYGSETGNCERYASLTRQALHSFRPIVATLNTYGAQEDEAQRESLATFSHIIVITSTFSDGKAPSNANTFLLEDLPELVEVNYTVLAAGSSIYPNFAAFGRQVDIAMTKSGANRFIQQTFVDEVNCPVGTFEIWLNTIKTFFAPFADTKNQIFTSSDQTATLEVSLVSVDEMLIGSGKTAPVNTIPNFVEAPVSINVELLPKPTDGSSTRYIVFDTNKMGFNYRTGDHLAVHPVNPTPLVERTCKLLNIDPDVYFSAEYRQGEDRYPAFLPFKMPITVRNALTLYLDIHLNEELFVDVVRLLRKNCAHTNKGDASRLKQWTTIIASRVQSAAKEGSLIGMRTAKSGLLGGKKDDEAGAAFSKILDLLDQFVTLADLLEEFPNIKLTFSEILGVLPRQKPRYYSISSSNISAPNKISICVGVIQIPSTNNPSKIRYGLCSNYLSKLIPGGKALISLKTSMFRLPKSVSTPILMIGAGTGVAPFLGFLSEIQNIVQQTSEGSKATLIFGCKSQDDYIFQSELEQYSSDKILKDLHVAFSREGKEKVYVQNIVERHGAEIYKFLENKESSYYLCGGAAVADAMYEALIGVIRKHGKKSRVAAVAMIDKMRVEGRYNLDVWGIVTHYKKSMRDIQMLKTEATRIWREKL